MALNSSLLAPVTVAKFDSLLNPASKQNDQKSYQNPPVSRKSQLLKTSSRNRQKGPRSGTKWEKSDELDLSVAQQKGKGRNKQKIDAGEFFQFQSYKDLKEYQEKHLGNRSRGNNSPRPFMNKRGDYPPKIQLKGMTFINVNYKFVVDSRQEYKSQLMDPNVPLDLKDVIRIIVPKGNACPICLTDQPVAPRMVTSCGHILCLSCLILLLDSALPKAKKQEADAVVEKYRECPLCTSIIRKKDIKPVLVNHTDERFETPRINDDVVLTLMERPQLKALALPKSMHEFQELIPDFPWISSGDHSPDFSLYLRIFKADMAYLLSMYELEKQQILQGFEDEKELYNIDDKYIKLAIKDINDDIEMWQQKFGEPNVHKLSPSQDEGSRDDSYYFYEAGFNAPSVYVLSPLDVKILKTNYDNEYTNMPSSLVAKIENIRYEELTEENALTRYKYLNHLPWGTTIAFMECNWKGNEYLSNETWKMFEDDLTQRSRTSARKFKREEKNRVRALNEEEIRTRNFFERENNPHRLKNDEYEDDYGYDGNMGTLSIVDHRELPPLLRRESDASSTASSSAAEGRGSSSGGYSGQLTTTIWGTQIPKAEVPEDSVEDDWDAAEMIRKAKEDFKKQNGGKKGRKKKVILQLI